MKLNLTFKNLFIKLFLVLLLSLISSCVQSPQTNRKSKTLPAATPTKDTFGESPTFNTNLNFIDQGTLSSTADTTLPTTYASSLKLRGREIDGYIRSLSIKSNHCIIERFRFGNNVDSDDTLLLLAGIPISDFQFGINVQEHFFQMVPSIKATNQSVCQKTGILNQLALQFPDAKVVYSFADICSGCSQNQLQGDGLFVMSTDGSSVTNINSNYLKINLVPQVTSTTQSGNTCSDSSECKSRGFDCCALGQCVINGSTKDGAVTASNQQEFQNSQIIISLDPARLTDFPEFYNICAVAVTPTATPTAIPGQERNDSDIRLTELKELYECTTPNDGEQTYKTITYQNSSTATQPFLTGIEDRNFTTTYSGTAGISQNSIVEIIHGGEILFKDGITLVPGFTIGPLDNKQGNDSLTDGTDVSITHQVRDKNVNDELKIKFKIDGSCEEVFTGLAKCFKVYKQGQNLGTLTDHFPASNEFKIPYYANTGTTISVEVDDVLQSQGLHWQLNNNRDTIIFQGFGLQVQDTQVVKINYFVDTTFNNVLNSKNSCLDRISQICTCQGQSCTLDPVTSLQNNQDVITDYKCVYPDPDIPEPPLQQTISMSAKTVPHRYFDVTGVFHSEITGSTPVQEGNEFKYIDEDKLKPNNIDQVIGFNEILGSFQRNGISAKPAREIRVVKNRTYDIFVNSGSYSTCNECGNDYWAFVARLFPRNFLHNGGGYQPDGTTTNRVSTPFHRSDESLYGRACWLPPTMIPWSHRANSNLQNQRLRRLAAQHFYFANGYQRDWFGFDYGSIIGSFDGVTWFAVGSERKIKATGNKLYLAVNGYFGDLTVDESFSITIQESLGAGGAGSNIETNFENNGAECQKFHVCSTDSDCFGQLGWDYTCQNITGITSDWPVFDDNGLEKPGATVTQRLSSLFQTTGSPNRRCVYRGKGTPCYADFASISASNSYAGTESRGFHACAMTSYCEQFIEGVSSKRFNNRISRYAASVNLQNLSPTVPESDLTTFGLGARTIGRPLKFNGTEEVDIQVQSTLSSNDVRAICIPGREGGNGGVSVEDSNGALPGNFYKGDFVLNIGMTLQGIGGPGAATNQGYLSLCSVLDEDNNLLFHKTGKENLQINSVEVRRNASAQAISTNSLDIFQTTTFGLNSNSLTDDFLSQITFRTYQKNRCMRAPGSVCFSDSDCAPNKDIATALSSLNPENFVNILNKYEIKYWQEELVCSQENPPESDDFDLTKNRCCRESGKLLSMGIFQTGTTSGLENFDNTAVPGVDIALNDPKRYTRNSTIKRELDTKADHPKMEYGADDTCTNADANNTNGNESCGVNISLLAKQFNSINTLAQRTCCSTHWVRNFHAESGNEENHKWESNLGQDIPKDSFSCYNWLKCDPSTDSCAGEVGLDIFGQAGTQSLPFTCDHVDQPTNGKCLARTVSNPEAETIFKFVRSLDLIGIPQVPIETSDNTVLQCQFDATDTPLAQSKSNSSKGLVLPGTIKEVNSTSNTAEYKDSTNKRYFSSMDMNNFDSDLKQIFSKDSFSCCLPAGVDHDAGIADKDCCTGNTSNEFTGADGNAKKRCVLPDFADVTLFFNKYVSSATTGLSDSLFEERTGFLKSSSVVEQLACELNICQSGVVARGIAHNNFRLTGPADDSIWQPFRIKRFIDGSGPLKDNFSGLVDYYDAGMRWNTNVYCFPPGASLPSDASTVLTITNCGNASN